MRTLLFRAMMLLAVVVVIGGGCKGKQSPKAVVENTHEAMSQIESLSYTAHIHLEGKGFSINSSLEQSLSGEEGNAEEGAVDIQLSGQTAVNGFENAHSSFSMRISSPDSPERVTLDMRQIENNIFVKISELSGIDGMDDAMTSLFTGRWIAMPQQGELEGMFGADMMDENTEDELTPAQEQELKKLVEETEFFSIVEDRGTADVNGAKTTHYVVTMNRSEVERFVDEAAKITEDPMTADEQAEFERILHDVEGKEAELWIGNRDSRIYRFVAMDLPIRNEDGTTDGTADITVNITDYNQDISVEAPEDAMSVMELVGSMMGGMMMQGFGDMQMPAPAEPVPMNDESLNMEELQAELEQYQQMAEQMQGQFAPPQ